MWDKIIDCKKQILLNKKVRQILDGRVLVYSIIEIESDQYHLKLLSRDNVATADKVVIILSPAQLIKNEFEIEG